MSRYGLLLSALLPSIPCDKEFSLKKNTTVGVGGEFTAFSPQTVGQLLTLVKLCERCQIPYFPLGAGSNVLATDGAYAGVVLDLSAFNRLGAEGDVLTAECGVRVGKLLSFCKQRGLSGLEFLAGIPASVGGLTFMNGGIKNFYVGDVIESVTYLQRGKIKNLSPNECQFSYKHSLFQLTPCVILSVQFRLKRTDRQTIEENISYFLSRRKNLPKGKSMGCIFKNPSGEKSAGELIEKSGGKGMTEGGATVSDEHANFIINADGATFQDFKILIEKIKRLVFEKTGVLLVEEIRYLQ